MKNGFRVLLFLIIFSSLPIKFTTAESLPIVDSNATISMDLQNADLKDILKIFSIQSRMNFIASEAVQDRKLTLYLDKVPVKDAMDKIFKANNLTYELDKEAKIFIVKDWGKPALETITKVYCIKNRALPDAKLVSEKDTLLTKGTASGSDIVSAIKQVLTSSGKITQDINTNSLIITDVASSFPGVEQIIAKLDVPVAQVLIDVEMLDVSKNTVDQLGLNFGTNPLSLLVGRAGGQGNKLRAFLGDVTLKAPQVFDPTSAGVVAIGGIFAETLDFLRTQTDTKYLARPRLLTLNNETAEIKLTKDEVVEREDTVTNTSGVSTVSSVFKRASELKLTDKGVGIFLRVTPQINPDTNEIIMVINPQSSVTTQSPLSVTRASATQGVNLLSDPEVRETKSIVKVRDGETVVLGGLLHTDKQVITSKVPILSDIPIIGALFRHKNQTKDLERELIVFITPHIVKDRGFLLAKAKKINFPEREEMPILESASRESAIDESLNNFEKTK
jgi:type IV pilus assembly protein PilQ